MTVTLDEATPSAAAKRLGVPAKAIDRAFGVVAIDPGRRLFAVRIPASVQPAAPPDDTIGGPFADPAITPPDRKPRDKR